MEAAIKIYHTEEQALPELNTLEATTLYDLVEAISEEVEPEDDWLVTEIVLDLFLKKQNIFFNPTEISFS